MHPPDLTDLKFGLIPGDGGARFLQRLIGYQIAFVLTMSDKIIDAVEAKALGIVLVALEPERLLARAQELAARLPDSLSWRCGCQSARLKMAQRIGVE